MLMMLEIFIYNNISLQELEQNIHLPTFLVTKQLHILVMIRHIEHFKEREESLTLVLILKAVQEFNFKDRVYYCHRKEIDCSQQKDTIKCEFRLRTTNKINDIY